MKGFALSKPSLFALCVEQSSKRVMTQDEFVEWIYENPARCPGVRLHHETYRQLLLNCNDIPEVGDFSDLAHVSAVPYVDAATLDNRMRAYCSQASRDLVRLGLCVDYRQRLYRNLADVMQRNP